MLDDLSRLREGCSRRISSWDTTSGNADAWAVEAGETRTLANLKGAGLIRHICDDSSSTAYCLQTLPGRPFSPFPPVGERLTRQNATVYLVDPPTPVADRSPDGTVADGCPGLPVPSCHER